MTYWQAWHFDTLKIVQESSLHFRTNNRFRYEHVFLLLNLMCTTECAFWACHVLFPLLDSHAKNLQMDQTASTSPPVPRNYNLSGVYGGITIIAFLLGTPGNILAFRFFIKQVSQHHLTQPHTTSHHLTQPHITSHTLTPPHTTSQTPHMRNVYL